MKTFLVGCSFCKKEFTNKDEAKALASATRHEESEHPFLAYNPNPQMIDCSEPECDQSIRDHYWSKVRAGDRGWFFQKSGESWCPDHNPPWVAEWRANKSSKFPSNPT